MRISGLSNSARKAVAVTAALVLATGLPACARSAALSGIFVGRSLGHVEMVQLVQTPDGRLTGRIEELTVTQTGEVKDDALAMEGAGDGRQFTLSPKSGFVAAFGGSVSGAMSGDEMQLSWQGGNATLRRSDVAGFNAAVAQLRQQAASTVQYREAFAAAQAKLSAGQKLQETAGRVSDQIAAFDRLSPAIIDKINQLNSQIVSLGQEARRDRRQQRGLEALGGGLAAMRSGTDAQGAVVQMSGVHLTLVGLRRDTNSSLGEIVSGLLSIQTACRNDPLAGQASDPCPNFDNQKARLQSVFRPLHEAFESSERTYAEAMATANQ